MKGVSRQKVRYQFNFESYQSIERKKWKYKREKLDKIFDILKNHSEVSCLYRFTKNSTYIDATACTMQHAIDFRNNKLVVLKKMIHTLPENKLLI